MSNSLLLGIVITNSMNYSYFFSLLIKILKLSKYQIYMFYHGKISHKFSNKCEECILLCPSLGVIQIQEVMSSKLEISYLSWVSFAYSIILVLNYFQISVLTWLIITCLKTRKPKLAYGIDMVVEEQLTVMGIL